MTDEQLHELMEAHKHYSMAAAVFKSAHEEITRLRNDRDELRREICGYSFEDARGVAKLRGWDCFKENTDEH